MSLSVLKKKGIPLPQIETEDGLTAKDIMDKMRSFYRRLEKCHSEIAEYAESYFLELIFNYPKSMCNRHMSEALKEVMALLYFESKPKHDGEAREKKGKDEWPGFSYDDLSTIFDMSKASIHEAIRQKEVHAKQLLEEVKLRAKAKEIVLEEYVQEERRKLLENNLKESKELTK